MASRITPATSIPANGDGHRAVGDADATYSQPPLPQAAPAGQPLPVHMRVSHPIRPHRRPLGKPKPARKRITSGQSYPSAAARLRPGARASPPLRHASATSRASPSCHSTSEGSQHGNSKAGRISTLQPWPASAGGAHVTGRWSTSRSASRVPRQDTSNPGPTAYAQTPSLPVNPPCRLPRAHHAADRQIGNQEPPPRHGGVPAVPAREGLSDPRILAVSGLRLPA